MVGITPAPVVTAPEPRGLRYGLLTTAIGPIDLPLHGQVGGVQYEPVSCGRARSYPVECPTDRSPTEKIFDTGESTDQFDPFVVYASYLCGAAGYTGAELEAKVRRRLANGEQGAVEQEMATLLAAGAVPLIAPDPTDLTTIVGELEQWLYGTGATEAAYGNVGYLHASPRTAAYAAAADLLVRDGPLWRTHLGTVWVLGGGYPDGTVYISGTTTIWRDPDVFVPPAAQVLNRTTNEYYLIAERTYVVSYDCVAAVADFDTGALS